ncbi:MAG: hypothetical protein WC393_04585, partial [Candidatus Nanoarchaeia archaeon]
MGNTDKKNDTLLVLIFSLMIFSFFILPGALASSGVILGITVIVFIIGDIILFFLASKSETPIDFLIPIVFLVTFIIIIITNPNINSIFSSFIFWTLLGVTGSVIIQLFKAIFAESKLYYVNSEGTFKTAKYYDGLSDDEKKKWNESTKVKSELPVLLFKILRTIALTTLLVTSLWVLVSSPFSFFGGSLYGGIMQLIITVPLILLLSSTWASGNSLGLILITAGSFAAYMLSFMFPTLFANLWIVSTTSSAGAGASTIGSFSSISPLSYYKSTYIVKTGQTEKRMGPTYELITDDVVSSSFSIQGRLCDESILVASITFQNRAKFELQDLSLQMSALRSPYCFGSDGSICNICEVNFTVGDKGSTYTEAITNLPKGVPKTVNVPFKTRLAADVMEQVCKIRSNILVHYHTTSVFPLSFIDYNAYLISPMNIGNPLSTSSFGKILLSMDVGQQPVVVNYDTKDTDQVLLKLAWSQKGDGLVNNPKLVLYLPENLGQCEKVSNWETSYKGSLGTTYYGSYGYNKNKTALFDNKDFTCTNYLEEASSYDSVQDYCNTIFNENINSTLSSNKTAESLLYFTPAYQSSFKGMPSFDDACIDLATKGYSVCVTNKDVEQNEVLLCPL